ncbi:flotillin [Parelusimicrobium proximum]|uniref:SPFH domain-containing protein n=1 Tax=Parelusimicrobium proximum TaxID=3228953 RepID=UPI003D167710
MPLIVAILAGFLLLLCIWLVYEILSLRRVVATNQVHIVQRAKSATSYGKNSAAGNKYYEFPSWIPFIGVSVVSYPISVFDIDLMNYEAYDQGRLPFVVDVKAFFRIDNSDVAASRVSSFVELQKQLTDIVRGAVRSLLAKSDLESIMSERSIYGSKFTEEVTAQLTAWGVVPVKNIELMDIRDTKESRVIENIMAKKKSLIEMESRTEVAENKKKAEQAEIEASREVALKEEGAKQDVGIKQAEVARTVGIAKEKASQDIKEQAKVTAEKDMAVEKVKQVQLANINKEANIVKAEEDRSVAEIAAEATKKVFIVEAEGKKQAVELEASAALTAKQKEAQGIEAEGLAVAVAIREKELASVTAQVTLAEKVGANEPYQKYLIAVRQVEANEHIGIEQAKNLGKADIKIIANGGTVDSGVKNAMDIFSTKGGLAVASALEGLKGTEAGEKLVDGIGKALTPKENKK